MKIAISCILTIEWITPKIIIIILEIIIIKTKIDIEKWYGSTFLPVSSQILIYYFLNLINKHFQKNNLLSKIFNRNNLKISSSCTKNMSKIIHNHNKRVYWSTLNGKVWKQINTHVAVELRKPALLKETVTLRMLFTRPIFSLKKVNLIMTYIGITSLNWKFQYYNHKQLFNNPLLRNQTAFSKYPWKLKDEGLTPIINWKVLKKSSSTSSLHAWYNIYQEEKKLIF